MNNKNRLVWADNMKGMLITLVVLGHAIQYTLLSGCFYDHVWNYIYSFHMPAFMAVSGFLNYRPNKDMISRSSIVYRRFLQLIVPFFLWELIYIFIHESFTITSLASIVLHPTYWFL